MGGPVFPSTQYIQHRVITEMILDVMNLGGIIKQVKINI